MGYSAFELCACKIYTMTSWLPGAGLGSFTQVSPLHVLLLFWHICRVVRRLYFTAPCRTSWRLSLGCNPSAFRTFLKWCVTSFTFSSLCFVTIVCHAWNLGWCAWRKPGSPSQTSDMAAVFTYKCPQPNSQGTCLDMAVGCSNFFPARVEREQRVAFLQQKKSREINFEG